MHYLFIKIFVRFFLSLFRFCLFCFYNEIYSIEWLMIFDISTCLILKNDESFRSTFLLIMSRYTYPDDAHTSFISMTDKCNKAPENDDVEQRK